MTNLIIWLALLSPPEFIRELPVPAPQVGTGTGNRQLQQWLAHERFRRCTVRMEMIDGHLWYVVTLENRPEFPGLRVTVWSTNVNELIGVAVRRWSMQQWDNPADWIP